jgi:hypothetical protein
MGLLLSILRGIGSALLGKRLRGALEGIQRLWNQPAWLMRIESKSLGVMADLKEGGEKKAEPTSTGGTEGVDPDPFAAPQDADSDDGEDPHEGKGN